jgi:hypothetical protein
MPHGPAPPAPPPFRPRQVVSLACELLPRTPEAPELILLGLPASGAAPGAAPGAASGAAASGALAEDPELAARLAGGLLPLVLRAYAATVVPQVGVGTMTDSIVGTLCLDGDRSFLGQPWA